MGIMDILRGVDDPYMSKCMAELDKCDTINEMFLTLNKWYDLDTKLPFLHKQGMMLGLPKIIKETNVAKRLE